MEQNEFDVIIVGGGHAGIEAVTACCSMGLKTCLVTHSEVGIGTTPCNPAIGGVGKGQVVREINTLGGLMGMLADQSGIHYKTLNESKGFAVQSTRVQVDKSRYAENAKKALLELKDLTIVHESLESVAIKEKTFQVQTNKNNHRCKKLIITIGTFSSGKLHEGSKVTSGGRVNKPSSRPINEIFNFELNLKTKKFKTGTPPRLSKKTISYEVLIPQDGDKDCLNFHYNEDPFKRLIPQLKCYIAHTNEQTMNIIRENKTLSPIFNGQIVGVGPRYCPSIEDKAFRYPERHVHHVFLEPETTNGDLIYPNGVSSSLPKEIQQKFINSISGLESAQIIIPGYAVEYDVIDTTQLDLTLMLKKTPGLYFAGQVNGTSGYEEAAGQGLIAGINAARSLQGKEKFILNRNNSYIGVMIEDLVTNFRDEPYRLFTARSENRLYIREDNVKERLKESVLLIEDDHDRIDTKMFYVEHDFLRNWVENMYYVPSEENTKRFKSVGYKFSNNNQKIKLENLIKLSEINPITVLKNELSFYGLKFCEEVIRNIAINIKYEGYIKKFSIQKNKFDKLENKKIDLDKILSDSNISFECRGRIKNVEPINFGQLRRISGLRPVTLSYVASRL